MEATELVLQAMREAGVPLNAGKIAELSVIAIAVGYGVSDYTIEQPAHRSPKLPSFSLIVRYR